MGEITQSRSLDKELPVKKELSPHEKVIKYCEKLEKYIKELYNSLNPPTMERKERLHSQINLLQGELGWPLTDFSRRRLIDEHDESSPGARALARRRLAHPYKDSPVLLRLLREIMEAQKRA